MAEASFTLDELRREIDEIDDAIHALLMRRVEVSRRVARTKNGSLATIRPAREMVVLRRLLKRHQGHLPKAVLIRIWREIFADSLAQQGAFTVAVQGGGQESLLGLAREHFGVLTPISEQGSPVRVLNAVAEGEVQVGLLAPAEPEAQDPWWRYLGRGEPAPRIVARLPIAAAASPSAPSGASAFVLGLTEPEPSGDDRSLLVVEAAQQISRSALRELLTRIGLEVRQISVWDGGADQRMHLIEVDGFVAPDDARLEELRRIDRDRLIDSWLAGAYAVPFEEQELNDPRTASLARTAKS